MKSEPNSDALIPPALLAELRVIANEEHRAPGEIVGEALERYLRERRLFRGDEVHVKIAAGLESLRSGKGLNGEAVIAELIGGLDEQG
jgi:predicted transcriptional regulator